MPCKSLSGSGEPTPPGNRTSEKTVKRKFRKTAQSTRQKIKHCSTLFFPHYLNSESHDSYIKKKEKKKGFFRETTSVLTFEKLSLRELVRLADLPLTQRLLDFLVISMAILNYFIMINFSSSAAIYCRATSRLCENSKRGYLEKILSAASAFV